MEGDGESEAKIKKTCHGRRKSNNQEVRRSGRVRVDRIKKEEETEQASLIPKRSNWTTSERQTLLLLLKERTAQGQFDYTPINRAIRTKNRGDVEKYVTRLREKVCAKKIAEAQEKSPIEMWCGLMQNFGSTDNDIVSVMNRAMCLATGERFVFPKGIVTDDFKPNRIYRYLAALIMDRETPGLTPLESQIVLDCFQHLLETMKTNDMKEQTAFLKNQYSKLYNMAYTGGPDFQDEGGLDIRLENLPGTADGLHNQSQPSNNEAPPISDSGPPTGTEAVPPTSDAMPSTSDATPSTSNALPTASAASANTNESTNSKGDSLPSASTNCRVDQGKTVETDSQATQVKWIGDPFASLFCRHLNPLGIPVSLLNIEALNRDDNDSDGDDEDMANDPINDDPMSDGSIDDAPMRDHNDDHELAVTADHDDIPATECLDSNVTVCKEGMQEVDQQVVEKEVKQSENLQTDGEAIASAVDVQQQGTVERIPTEQSRSHEIKRTEQQGMQADGEPDVPSVDMDRIGAVESITLPTDGSPEDRTQSQSESMHENGAAVAPAAAVDKCGSVENSINQTDVSPVNPSDNVISPIPAQTMLPGPCRTIPTVSGQSISTVIPVASGSERGLPTSIGVTTSQTMPVSARGQLPVLGQPCPVNQVPMLQPVFPPNALRPGGSGIPAGNIMLGNPQMLAHVLNPPYVRKTVGSMLERKRTMMGMMAARPVGFEHLQANQVPVLRTSSLPTMNTWGGVPGVTQPQGQLLTLDLSHLTPSANIVIPASVLPGGILTIKSPEHQSPDPNVQDSVNDLEESGLKRENDHGSTASLPDANMTLDPESSDRIIPDETAEEDPLRIQMEKPTLHTPDHSPLTQPSNVNYTIYSQDGSGVRNLPVTLSEDLGNEQADICVQDASPNKQTSSPRSVRVSVQIHSKSPENTCKAVDGMSRGQDSSIITNAVTQHAVPSKIFNVQQAPGNLVTGQPESNHPVSKVASIQIRSSNISGKKRREHSPNVVKRLNISLDKAHRTIDDPERGNGGVTPMGKERRKRGRPQKNTQVQGGQSPCSRTVNDPVQTDSRCGNESSEDPRDVDRDSNVDLHKTELTSEKRKRGRPPKAVGASLGGTEEVLRSSDQCEQVEGNSTPAKRKRGRPRKNTSEISPQEPGPSSEKRQRGRPRKSFKAAADQSVQRSFSVAEAEPSSEAVIEMDLTMSTEKRKRGRPQKNAQGTTTVRGPDSKETNAMVPFSLILDAQMDADASTSKIHQNTERPPKISSDTNAVTHQRSEDIPVINLSPPDSDRHVKVDASPATKKQKSGRPPKSTYVAALVADSNVLGIPSIDLASSDSDDTCNIEIGSSTSKEKQKRGRPSKNAQSTTTVTSPDSKESNTIVVSSPILGAQLVVHASTSQVQQNRGRPSKISIDPIPLTGQKSEEIPVINLSSTDSDRHDEVDASPAKEKRKRGRPPKSPNDAALGIDSNVLGIPAVEISSTDSDKHDKVDGSPAKEKRKRGRPPKSSTNASPDALGGPSVEQSSKRADEHTGLDASPSKEKRKRGRPPKHDTSASPGSPQSAQSPGGEEKATDSLKERNAPLVFDSTAVSDSTASATSAKNTVFLALRKT